MLRLLFNKAVKILFTVLLFIVVLPVAAIAQTGTAPPEPINLDIVFVTLAGLTTAVILLTSLVKKKYSTKDGVTIWVSVIIGFIISALGWLFQLGMFAELEWYYIFIYGLASSLMANGFASWPVISAVLKVFKLKVPSQ